MGLVDNLKALLTWQAPPAPPGRKGLLDWAQQPYFVRDQYRYDPLTGTTYSTTIDYAAAAGDLGTNGIIMACIGWLMRAEPEAPWRIQRRTAQGTSAVAAHALYDLLLRPNPFYSGLALRQATCFSFNLAGNAYWLKTRNAGGRVIQLWWEPHTTIRAHWPSDGSAFIDGYEIYRGGRWWPIPAEDVVHFRDGLDPANPRYGLSPLGAALPDGDYVHAVIRGWAANHGGKTNGYTVPNPKAQYRLLNQAHAVFAGDHAAIKKANGGRHDHD